MRRTDRLFELIQLFRGGRLWKGRDLAERLDTSLRTVYRDIDTLVASGIPIEGERGVGFILREPIFLPPLTLTRSELDALHLGVAMVARIGDATLGEAAARLREKIDAVLPSGRRGVDHAVGVAIYTPTPQGRHEHLPALRDAIAARRIVDIAYTKLDETHARRTIRPLHLEFWGQVWTLTAWCELRSDFRVFRVDRIERLEVCERSFRNERGKSYKDYLSRCDADDEKVRATAAR